MDAKKTQSQTIDYLRFTLIIGVVFAHTNDFAPHELINFRNIDYLNLSGFDIYTIIARVCSEFIPSLVVPLFFLISGFLFFIKTQNWNAEDYKVKIKGRVKTLLIPYIIWNTLALIALRLTPNGFMYYNIPTDVFEHYTVFSYIKGYIFWNGYSPYLNPMWFIRDLFVLCLMSPLIFFFIKKVKYWGLILIFINYWLDLLPPLFFITKEPLFFFSLGAFAGIFKKNIVTEAKKINVICFIVSIIALFAFLYFREGGAWKYIKPFYVFSGIVTSISLTAYVLERGKAKVRPFLTKSSFFVFALHQLVILGAWIKTYMLVVKPTHVIEYILGYFFVPVATILTCILIYFLLQKYLPSIAGILTGNRNNIQRG